MTSILQRYSHYSSDTDADSTTIGNVKLENSVSGIASGWSFSLTKLVVSDMIEEDQPLKPKTSLARLITGMTHV
jgi:hypothetical protein